jgi:hypothetical protein
MSRNAVSRRQFLTLALLSLLSPPTPARAEAAHRQGVLDVAVGLLYSALTLGLQGTIEEAVDQRAGRYEVTASGQGRGLASRLHSQGIERAGRWAHVRATGWFQIAGREARTELTYDYERRRVHYQFRGETFFLRRLRVADDTMMIPAGIHLDDVMSAILNYAEGRWPVAPDGAYRTSIVRRRRPENEGPDEIQQSYQAEITPLALRVAVDPQTGKPVATFDLTPLSSWARAGQPARIVFGVDRRPETVSASLILGTSVNIRLRTSS